MKLPITPLITACTLFWCHTVLAQTPANFKIAFIGDSGIDQNAVAVLNLIAAEGADVIIHAGDLDYDHNPQAFEDHINNNLGPEFPYFYSVGNHDQGRWRGTGGYQSFLEARFQRLGIPWSGDLGVKSAFTYRGIFFLAMAPDELGLTPQQATDYIREQLGVNEAIWSIAFWHKNQRRMQVGGKRDEAGWGVYEESRRGGAIIATGHEHTYSRTHLMRHMENLEVADTTNSLILVRDNLDTAEDEGRSFAFVSALSGLSIRDQELFDNHWASVYTSTQGATYGALFGEFNYMGRENLAHFYFKDINGVIPDEFYVKTTVDFVTPSGGNGLLPHDPNHALGDAFPNPLVHRGRFNIMVAEEQEVRITLHDVLGRQVRMLFEGRLQANTVRQIEIDGSGLPPGVYFYRAAGTNFAATRRVILMR